MYEQLKNQWLPILEKTKLDSNYYDKVLNYIQAFMLDNTMYNSVYLSTSVNNGNNDISIISHSINVLCEVDLNKVQFINYPMGMGTFLLNVRENIDIVGEVSRLINNKVNEGFEVRIYKLIESITETNNGIEVISRLCFHKPGEPEPNYINNIWNGDNLNFDDIDWSQK